MLGQKLDYEVSSKDEDCGSEETVRSKATDKLLRKWSSKILKLHLCNEMYDYAGIPIKTRFITLELYPKEIQKAYS